MLFLQKIQIYFCHPNMRWLTTTYNCSSRGTSLQPPWVSALTCTDIYTMKIIKESNSKRIKPFISVSVTLSIACEFFKSLSCLSSHQKQPHWCNKCHGATGTKFKAKKAQLKGKSNFQTIYIADQLCNLGQAVPCEQVLLIVYSEESGKVEMIVVKSAFVTSGL